MSDNYCTPQTFGAKGDGITDDSDSLQKWLNHIIGNGITGYIPNGHYRIKKGGITYRKYVIDSSTELINKDTEKPSKPFSIIGESTKGVILDFKLEGYTAAINCLDLRYLDDFKLENFTIKCNGGNNQKSGAGLYLVGCNNANFNNIDIIDCSYIGVLVFTPTPQKSVCDGLIFDKVNIYGVENNYVLNIKSPDILYPWGYILTSCVNTIVKNSFVKGMKWYTFELKNNCDNSHFSNCTAEDCAIGCYTGYQYSGNYTSYAPVDKIGVRNCTFTNIKLNNVIQEFGGGDCENCIFDVISTYSKDYIPRYNQYLIRGSYINNSIFNITSNNMIYGGIYLNGNSKNNIINFKNIILPDNDIIKNRFCRFDNTSINNFIDIKSRSSNLKKENFNYISSSSILGKNIIIDYLDGLKINKI